MYLVKTVDECAIGKVLPLVVVLFHSGIDALNPERSHVPLLLATVAILQDHRRKCERVREKHEGFYGKYMTQVLGLGGSITEAGMTAGWAKGTWYCIAFSTRLRATFHTFPPLPYQMENAIKTVVKGSGG